MKLKLILIIAGIAVAGSTVTIVVIQSKDRTKEREAERQKSESTNQLQSALSNYSRTFKLNTNPPLWPDGTTNKRPLGSKTNRSPAH